MGLLLILILKNLLFLSLNNLEQSTILKNGQYYLNKCPVSKIKTFMKAKK
jgi:hypothetical protein